MTLVTDNQNILMKNGLNGSVEQGISSLSKIIKYVEEPCSNRIQSFTPILLFDSFTIYAMQIGLKFGKKSASLGSYIFASKIKKLTFFGFFFK